jgi:mannose/fructose/N-acetylgalactosamine-specific phosphotransferase system component IID
MKRGILIGSLFTLVLAVLVAAIAMWLHGAAGSADGFTFIVDDERVHLNAEPGVAMLAVALALAAALVVAFVAVLFVVIAALVAATLGVVAALAAVLVALAVALSPIWLVALVIWLLVRKSRSQSAPNGAPNTTDIKNANIAA